MATFNVELRERTGGAFTDIIYIKANWNYIDNKPSTYTPSSHAHGDIANDGTYSSKTAKYILAAPNAANGVPSFRALVASDIPTLNQDTTGKATSRAYVTTCPTANNTDGGMRTYVGSTNCATKYTGYEYLITA